MTLPADAKDYQLYVAIERSLEALVDFIEHYTRRHRSGLHCRIAMEALRTDTPAAGWSVDIPADRAPDMAQSLVTDLNRSARLIVDLFDSGLMQVSVKFDIEVTAGSRRIAFGQGGDLLLRGVTAREDMPRRMWQLLESVIDSAKFERPERSDRGMSLVQATDGGYSMTHGGTTVVFSSHEELFESLKSNLGIEPVSSSSTGAEPLTVNLGLDSLVRKTRMRHGDKASHLTVTLDIEHSMPQLDGSSQHLHTRTALRSADIEDLRNPEARLEAESQMDVEVRRWVLEQRALLSHGCRWLSVLVRAEVRGHDHALLGDCHNRVSVVRKAADCDIQETIDKWRRIVRETLEQDIDERRKKYDRLWREVEDGLPQ